MPNKKNSKYCRVCGLSQEDLPWGEDGKTPSFEICHCCGVEFGYEDSSVDCVKRFRADWILKGSNWFDDKEKPPNWNLKEQLKNIPEEFREEI